MHVTCAWFVEMRQNNERDETHTAGKRKICVSSGQMLMVLLDEEVKGCEAKHKVAPNPNLWRMVAES